MKFKELKQYKQQNLKSLYQGIKELYKDTDYSPKFKMKHYSVRSDQKKASTPKEAGCNTVCCLVGHGPQLGIISDDPGIMGSWERYVTLFVNKEFDDVYDFLFCPIWPDNIQQALKRLRMFIFEDFDPVADWDESYHKINILE